MYMLDRVPRDTIKEDSRRRGAKMVHNPITEAWRKFKALEYINNIFPPNMVKGLLNVELE
jgi:hypothetical protein